MMSDPETSAPTLFALTPRQRRLRVITLTLLAVIAVMIVVYALHPFFRFERPPLMTPVVRKALAVKAMMIWGYLTVCFLLAVSLVFIAWLDLREVRRKMQAARRAILKESVEEMRQRIKKSSEP